MGKGDKKTKRGKIIQGSYGVRRPRKISVTPVIVETKKKKPEKVTEVIAEKPKVKKVSAKKVSAKKTEDKPLVEKEPKAKVAPKKEDKE